jgi:hypothetical protein
MAQKVHLKWVKAGSTPKCNLITEGKVGEMGVALELT